MKNTEFQIYMDANLIDRVVLIFNKDHQIELHAYGMQLPKDPSNAVVLNSRGKPKVFASLDTAHSYVTCIAKLYPPPISIENENL